MRGRLRKPLAGRVVMEIRPLATPGCGLWIFPGVASSANDPLRKELRGLVSSHCGLHANALPCG